MMKSCLKHAIMSSARCVLPSRAFSKFYVQATGGVLLAANVQARSSGGWLSARPNPTHHPYRIRDPLRPHLTIDNDTRGALWCLATHPHLTSPHCL